MKLIIAGPRDYTDYERVMREAFQFINMYGVDGEGLEIVSGGCSDKIKGVLTFTRDDGSKVYGVDGLGERFAKERGCSVELFMADWKKHGKSAGPIRNGEMAKYATHAIVFTRPDSRGSNDMLKKAIKELGELNVKEVKIKTT